MRNADSQETQAQPGEDGHPRRQAEVRADDRTRRSTGPTEEETDHGADHAADDGGRDQCHHHHEQARDQPLDQFLQRMARLAQDGRAGTLLPDAHGVVDGLDALPVLKERVPCARATRRRPVDEARRDAGPALTRAVAPL